MSATAFQRMRREIAKRKIEIEQEVEGKPLDEMDLAELKAYAFEKGIEIGNSNTIKGILKKIQEAEMEE